jgi:chorismate mutase
MIRTASSALGILGTTAAFAFGTVGSLPAAHADVPSPLFALVDAAAQRLQTADAVAAVKWIGKGAIEDPARERQVIDAVTAAAKAHGVDPAEVERIFRNQIDATVGVEYARFSAWKLDPASAPATAPDLSASRAVIDGLNATMVDQLAAQRDSLDSPHCAEDLQTAEDAVVGARNLDDLYREALSSATRSYCAVNGR